MKHSRISYPAKFAFGLISRIVAHGLEQGYWRKGELIGDCFGGVALGGVVCGSNGLDWIGVELEERFVELGNQNLAKHGPLFMHSGATCVKLVQGDSRRFASIVGEVAGVVCSPPFLDVGSHDPNFLTPGERRKKNPSKSNQINYGSTPGQIGSLKIGELTGIVTSPPFADTLSLDRPNAAARRAVARERGISNAEHISPIDMEKLGKRHEGDYGSTDGNIGNLKAGKLAGIVTSPPWESSGDAQRTCNDDGTRARQATSELGKYEKKYGQTEGQIGNDKAESYWQAMRLVYEQCHQAIKPGGVMACVVKDFVKGGQIVPLCDDTCKLLESCGFTVFERTRCHLVRTTTERSLFGDDIVTTKSRKSFFRRLAEKNGSPEINWEEVIWAKNQP